MSDSVKVSLKTEAIYQLKKEKTVKALRTGYSIGAISRAYDLPYRIIRHWREKESIPAKPIGGRGRPMPNVGEELT